MFKRKSVIVMFLCLIIVITWVNNHQVKANQLTFPLANDFLSPHFLATDSSNANWTSIPNGTQIVAVRGSNQNGYSDLQLLTPNGESLFVATVAIKSNGPQLEPLHNRVLRLQAAGVPMQGSFSAPVVRFFEYAGNTAEYQGELVGVRDGGLFVAFNPPADWFNPFVDFPLQHMYVPDELVISVGNQQIPAVNTYSLETHIDESLRSQHVASLLGVAQIPLDETVMKTGVGENTIERNIFGFEITADIYLRATRLQTIAAVLMEYERGVLSNRQMAVVLQDLDIDLLPLSSTLVSSVYKFSFVLEGRAVLMVDDVEGEQWLVTLFDDHSLDRKYLVSRFNTERQSIRTMVPTRNERYVLLATIGDENFSLQRSLLLLDLNDPNHEGVPVHFADRPDLFPIYAKIVTNRAPNQSKDVILARYGFSTSPTVNGQNEHGGLYLLNTAEIIASYENFSTTNITLPEAAFQNLYPGSHVFDSFSPNHFIGTVWDQTQNAEVQPPSLGEFTIYLPVISKLELGQLVTLQKNCWLVKTNTGLNGDVPTSLVRGYTSGWNTNIINLNEAGYMLAIGYMANWPYGSLPTTMGVVEFR